MPEVAVQLYEKASIVGQIHSPSSFVAIVIIPIEESSYKRLHIINLPPVQHIEICSML